MNVIQQKKLFADLVAKKTGEVIEWEEKVQTTFDKWKDNPNDNTEELDGLTLDYLSFLVSCKREIRKAVDNERTRGSKIDSKVILDYRILLQKLTWQHKEVTLKMIHVFTVVSRLVKI